jgi:hypothetical protein
MENVEKGIYQMNNRLKVLIGGCSFSETSSWWEGAGFVNRKETTKPYRLKWPGELYSDGVDITNTAVSSASNQIIIERLKKRLDRYYENWNTTVRSGEPMTRAQKNSKYDLVIIQWSSFVRDFLPMIHKQSPPHKEWKENRKLFRMLLSSDPVESFIVRDLQQMVFFQNYLDKLEIPYIQFIGWSQFSNIEAEIPEVKKLLSELKHFYWYSHGKLQNDRSHCLTAFDKYEELQDLYDENYTLIPNNFGGMSEWVVDNFDGDRFEPNGDGHPTHSAHVHFYKHFLLPIIKEYIDV